jgi:YidC/Oxa1 family membrane protein insertase
MAQDVFVNYDRIVTSIPELAGMPQVDFTFLGMNLADTPHLMFWQQENVLLAFGLWMIPVISAALSVVSRVLNNKINAYVTGSEKKSNDPTQRSMMIMMPLMSLWICFTLPAALGLYWIYSSLSAMLSEFANIPFLRKFMKTEAEKKVRRAEELKEMERLERERKSAAKKKAQEENRRIQMERKLNKSVSTASREGLRTYARGRTYDPDRYPTFPYEDPNKILQKKREEMAAAAEAKQAKKGGKKDKAAVAAAPVVEETVETVTPVETAPVDTTPVHTEPAAEVEEGFVEESFLEENEEA